MNTLHKESCYDHFPRRRTSMTPQSVSMNVDTGEKTWLTPPHIIKALGPFDLDPCCPPQMPWQTATQMVCRPDDGLAVDWTGKRVWCNPPYGRESLPFLRKMAENRMGGGYFACFCENRHGGMARLDFPICGRHLVHARAAPLPQTRRLARRHGYGALCARRIHGTRLCPSARERA